MKKIAIICFIIAAITVCTQYVLKKNEDTWVCKNTTWVKNGNPSYPKPIITCGEQTPLPKNEADCVNQGGVWKKLGPDPFETCNIKARDRGNLCRDNSECEGLCQVNLTRDELSQGMRGKIYKNVKFGQCSVWRVELGCQGIMKNGNAQVMCLD